MISIILKGIFTAENKAKLRKWLTRWRPRDNKQLQEKIYKIQGLTIANYTACMWLSKSPVNIYTS